MACNNTITRRETTHHTGVFGCREDPKHPDLCTVFGITYKCMVWTLHWTISSLITCSSKLNEALCSLIFYQWYPLVNVYIAMERSSIFNGKRHELSTGPCSIANCEPLPESSLSYPFISIKTSIKAVAFSRRYRWASFASRSVARATCPWPSWWTTIATMVWPRTWKTTRSRPKWRGFEGSRKDIETDRTW